MRCKEFRNQLDRYLDQEIRDSELVQRLDEHSRSCAACGSLLDVRSKLVHSVRAMGRETLTLPPMEIYLAQLRENVAQPSQEGFWQRAWAHFAPSHAYAFGGFVLALLVVALFVQYAGNPSLRVAMPNQASFVEYLEIPEHRVSAVTYTNTQTNTTVVWLCGADVRATTSEGRS